MFTLKSYNSEKESQVDFFVISKGNNAGKPIREATPNCFEVKVIDEEILLPDYLYYMVLAAYEAGAFKKYLRGSVIPFITIEDFYKAFFEYYGEPL